MSIRKLNHICLIGTKRYTWAINPKIKKSLDENNKFIKAYNTSSLSLITIAALTPPDIDISYIDEDFEEIDFDIQYDMVGISAMTQQVIRSYEIAKEFRKRGTYVVMGGIHASFLPNEALEWVDTVIMGEGEDLWPQFLEDFKNNKEKKIYKQPEGTFVDLTKSPTPRYDLLTRKDYFKNNKIFYNMIPIQVSRGCPHNCEFCLVTKCYGSKFRKKTIEQIIREIKKIKEYFPGKVILFADDNLFIDKKFSKKLLKTIKDLNIRWWAQTDISIGEDEELLSLIYESGGLLLLIGFESIDPENLKLININSWKYKQLSNYSKNIERIQKHGIIVFGSFIFGLDNDDKNVFKNVVGFMDENNITGQLTIATPLPGSRLLERLKREDRLLENEPFWDKCTFFDVLYKPKKMTVEELEDGFIGAYKQVFNEKVQAKRVQYLKEIYKKII
ncbi:B12-binding domain-containing radical SAM protein [Desulfotignum phosphitoxidans]|uniref:Acyl carrier protein n=1 Tax=Desulfotignum phosphitoxidans DSM 13687 TaxID=1286635 RepID=S0G0C6_9BACT|nr:radical SAM protein [Desulfotignum phosphitoxidans]EMS80828.1 acyl carrier protein [Desulfotignum phosphitoxidans DSM 13687]